MPTITLEKLAFYEKELLNNVKMYLTLLSHIFSDDKLGKDDKETLQEACERLSSFDGIAFEDFKVFFVINKILEKLGKFPNPFYVELLKKEYEIKFKVNMFRPDGTHCSSVNEILHKRSM